MLSTRTFESDIETEIISSEDMAQMQVDHTTLGGQFGMSHDHEMLQDVDPPNGCSLVSNCPEGDGLQKPNETHLLDPQPTGMYLLASSNRVKEDENDPKQSFAYSLIKQ